MRCLLRATPLNESSSADVFVSDCPLDPAVFCGTLYGSVDVQSICPINTKLNSTLNAPEYSAPT